MRGGEIGAASRGWGVSTVGTLQLGARRSTSSPESGRTPIDPGQCHGRTWSHAPSSAEPITHNIASTSQHAGTVPQAPASNTRQIWPRLWLPQQAWGCIYFTAGHPIAHFCSCCPHPLTPWPVGALEAWSQPQPAFLPQLQLVSCSAKWRRPVTGEAVQESQESGSSAGSLKPPLLFSSLQICYKKEPKVLRRPAGEMDPGPYPETHAKWALLSSSGCCSEKRNTQRPPSSPVSVFQVRTHRGLGWGLGTSNAACLNYS